MLMPHNIPQSLARVYMVYIHQRELTYIQIDSLSKLMHCDTQNIVVKANGDTGERGKFIYLQRSNV